MEEQQLYPYRGHAIINRDLFYEGQRAYRHSHIPTILLRLMTCVFLVLLYGMFHQTRIRMMFTILTLCLALTWLRQWIRERKGIAFRSFLEAYQGNEPTVYTFFNDQGIHIRHDESGPGSLIGYDSLRKILETEHTLILVLPKRKFIPIRKYSIQGCTPEALCQYIFTRTGKAQRKPCKGKLGIAATILYVLTIAAGIVLSLYTEYAETVLSPAEISGFQQAAEELENLGIEGCTPELIDELEQITQEYAVYGLAPDYRLDLLCWVGMGTYDEETWEWTPSRNGVYWFDAEVMNLDTMYTDFLRGISALDPESLDFSDIREDISKVNWEQGSGIQTVSFQWNVKQYTLRGKVNYDWFDIGVADDLAKLIQKAETGKQLYFAYDGGQGYLVFYADQEWADAFQKTTGIVLKKYISRLQAVY